MLKVVRRGVVTVEVDRRAAVAGGAVVEAAHRLPLALQVRYRDVVDKTGAVRDEAQVAVQARRGRLLAALQRHDALRLGGVAVARRRDGGGTALGRLYTVMVAKVVSVVVRT